MTQAQSELLRFTTAGSVDDGKSTLIGRLLYDSKSIFQDQYEAIERASARRGEEDINLALLTDGLKSEREQGITIDVAYRYFSTPKRKFIIADTPGHIQYTRNMVTGASTANVALILIDARHGVVEQTRRHAIISSLLQIPHLVVCVNKMDLVDYDQAAYEQIQSDFNAFSAQLAAKDVQFIPISALKGDNVVHTSDAMSWYQGESLMHYLEHVDISSDYGFEEPRFPVQLVVRPNTDAYHDYRGYAGRVAGGIFQKGDTVHLLPSGFATQIKMIQGPDGEQEQALPSQSVTLLLEGEHDLSRGDMITRVDEAPATSRGLDLMVCWFDQDRALRLYTQYVIRHTTQEARCTVTDIQYKLDINTMAEDFEDKEINLNDIARVTIQTTKPLFVDAYEDNRITGSVILIDESNNNTVAAGMVVATTTAHDSDVLKAVSPEERNQLNQHLGGVIVLTGEGDKSLAALAIVRQLYRSKVRASVFGESAFAELSSFDETAALNLLAQFSVTQLVQAGQLVIVTDENWDPMSEGFHARLDIPLDEKDLVNTCQAFIDNHLDEIKMKNVEGYFEI